MAESIDAAIGGRNGDFMLARNPFIKGNDPKENYANARSDNPIEILAFIFSPLI